MAASGAEAHKFVPVGCAELLAEPLPRTKLEMTAAGSDIAALCSPSACPKPSERKSTRFPA